MMLISIFMIRYRLISNYRIFFEGKLIFGFILLVLFSLSCGYKLVGKGISLPERYWSMAIPAFENRTSQQDIGQVITLSVIDAFSRRGELKIVSTEEANSVLKGVITSYREQPQNIGSSFLAKSYRIFITASVKLQVKKTKKIYWSDQKLYFSQDYDVSDENLGQTEFAQEEARRRAADDFADRLVSVVLEGF